MTGATPIDEADAVIAILRAMAPDLRRRGIKQMWLFGSLARGEAEPASDVDLAILRDRTVEMGLVQTMSIERELTETLGRPVEFMTLPIHNPYLRENIERDLRVVF